MRSLKSAPEIIKDGDVCGRVCNLYATEGFVIEALREPDLFLSRVRRTLVLQRSL